MPTVPVYERQVSAGQPRAREAGINPPRMVSPPIEAFGAADAKTMQALGQTINAVGMAGLNLATDEIRRENKIAEDTRFFGLSTRISEKALELQNHALQQKGRNAFGVHEVIDKEWSKLQDEVLKESGYSDTLKARVIEDLTKQRLGLKKQYEVHVANEAQELQINDLKARIAISKEKAASVAFDDDAIKSELGELDNVMATYANTYGLSSEDEAYKLTRLEHISGLHKKVIETRLGANSSMAAKEYFDKVRKDMTQDDAKEMESDLKGSLIRYKADTLSQEAASKYGTLNQAVKYFDSIKDLTPEEKEKAISLTRMRFDIKEEAKKKAQEYNYETLSSSVEKAVLKKNAGDPSAMSDFTAIQNSKEWKSLDVKYQDNLLERFNDADRPNDDSVWLEFSSLSRGQIAAISNADYQSDIRSRLSKEYRDKADTLRKQAKEGTAEENQTISKWSSYGKDVEQYLASQKIYPPTEKPTKGLAGVKLEQATQANRESMSEWNAKMIRIQEKVEQFEVRKGNKATPEEIRTVVAEQFLMMGPFKSEKGGAVATAPVTKPNEPVTAFSDIPEKEKSRGRAEFLRATGREPSDDELTEFYNAAKTRNMKRVEEILGIRKPGAVQAGMVPQPKRKPLAPIDYRKVPESKRVE